MKKILHLIPTLEGGGAERQLSLLISQQAIMGMEVHLVIRRGGVNMKNIDKENIFIHIVGDYRGLHLILFIKIYYLIRKIKPDIIQTWMNQMDILGGLIAVTSDIPWVLSERSSGKYNEGSFTQKIRKILAKNAIAIVANSNNAIENWKSIYPSKNIINIPNIIDFAAINKYKNYSKYHIYESKKLILVVCRINLQKGIQAVINAIKLINHRSDCKLLIIGDGPNKQYFVDLVTELNLTNQISFLPYDPEWWKYLFKASIFISMSEVEGQPNSLLEAIVGRTQLILSAINEHLELVHKDDAIFVEKDNIINLAEAILNALNNKDSFNEDMTKTLKKISTFDIKTITSSYLKLYDQLLMESK